MLWVFAATQWYFSVSVLPHTNADHFRLSVSQFVQTNRHALLVSRRPKPSRRRQWRTQSICFGLVSLLVVICPPPPWVQQRRGGGRNGRGCATVADTTKTCVVGIELCVDDGVGQAESTTRVQTDRQRYCLFALEAQLFCPSSPTVPTHKVLGMLLDKCAEGLSHPVTIQMSDSHDK